MASLGVLARPFEERDRERIYTIYMKSFAEPPWNEAWKREDVEQDLNFALSQKRSIVMVAGGRDTLLGFTWGYPLPLAKFTFLTAKIDGDTVYMDDIAVDPGARRRGVGKALCQGFIEVSGSLSFDAVVLRTDENNVSSMALFGSLGFERIGVYDPEYPTRLYLKKNLRD